jgi:hypothetical protein
MSEVAVAALYRVVEKKSGVVKKKSGVVDKKGK